VIRGLIAASLKMFFVLLTAKVSPW